MVDWENSKHDNDVTLSVFMSRIQVSVESIFDSVTCKKLCASNIVAVATLFS